MFGSQQYVSVIDYGALPTNTPAQNKTALQSAIADVDSRGRGVVVVPPDIDYGYKRNTLSTHPDFSTTANDILVIDYSMNTQYDDAYGDGMQQRLLSKTKNETDGSHDGNTFWYDGAWHPAIMINNTGNGKTNNRRATLFFCNDGEATWAVGQGINTAGINAPADATDDELSHFKIGGNKIAGGAGLETLLCINKVTGYWGFGTSSPDVEYHFRTKRGTKGQVKFESHESNIEVSFASPTKERAFTVREDNGYFNITDVGRISNVFQLSPEGHLILKQGIDVSSSTLPATGAGTIVFHDGQFKGFNGTSWVVLG
jgi:hypothetical protein